MRLDPLDWPLDWQFAPQILLGIVVVLVLARFVRRWQLVRDEATATERWDAERRLALEDERRKE